MSKLEFGDNAANDEPARFINIGLNIPYNPESLAALQGLLDEHGAVAYGGSEGFFPLLDGCDGFFGSSVTEVTADDLAAISKEQFGSEVYGWSASGRLDHLRPRSSRHTFRTNVATTVPTPQLKECVKRVWDKEKLPFEPEITDDGAYISKWERPRKFLPAAQDSFSYRAWKVSAGAVTNRSLWHYMSETGLLRPCLQGTLGKMLMVMSTAAESPIKLQSPVEDTDREFVTVAQLGKRMTASGLSSYYRRQIHDSIRTTLVRQLSNGHPSSLGELVVEGGASFGRYSDSIKYERIALDSLPTLSARFPDNPAREFLETLSR